jgi:hypothetical protein
LPSLTSGPVHERRDGGALDPISDMKPLNLLFCSIANPVLDAVGALHDMRPRELALDMMHAKE